MFYSFCMCVVFFFKQKTAYEMRISDWSSDVCSSDLIHPSRNRDGSCHSTGIQRLGALQNFSQSKIAIQTNAMATANKPMDVLIGNCSNIVTIVPQLSCRTPRTSRGARKFSATGKVRRSEEHTSELQSLMRISYAVFCSKHKKKK